MNDLETLAHYLEQHSAEAFKEIMIKYRGLVRSSCARLLDDPADVEDAVQETFVILAREAARIRQSPAGWLYRCAHRTARNKLNSNAARREREREWARLHESGRAVKRRM